MPSAMVVSLPNVPHRLMCRRNTRFSASGADCREDGITRGRGLAGRSGLWEEVFKVAGWLSVWPSLSLSAP